jgi:hypothetical protein
MMKGRFFPLPRYVNTPIVFTCLLMIAIAIVAAVRSGELPHAYMDEREFLTIFSCIQLLAIGLVLLFVFRIRRKIPEMTTCGSRGSWIWLLMALGFILLAVDEYTQLHETMDRWIHQGLAIEETGWTDRLDDMILLGYGLAGLAVMWWFRKELLQVARGLWLYLAVGMSLFGLQVVLDLATNRPDVLQWIFGLEPENLSHWLAAGEESIKVIAEAVFLAGSYHILYRVRKWSLMETS